MSSQEGQLSADGFNLDPWLAMSREGNSTDNRQRRDVLAICMRPQSESLKDEDEGDPQVSREGGDSLGNFSVEESAIQKDPRDSSVGLL